MRRGRAPGAKRKLPIGRAVPNSEQPAENAATDPTDPGATEKPHFRTSKTLPLRPPPVPSGSWGPHYGGEQVRPRLFDAAATPALVVRKDRAARISIAILQVHLHRGFECDVRSGLEQCAAVADRTAHVLGKAAVAMGDDVLCHGLPHWVRLGVQHNRLIDKLFQRRLRRHSMGRQGQAERHRIDVPNQSLLLPTDATIVGLGGGFGRGVGMSPTENIWLRRATGLRRRVHRFFLHGSWSALHSVFDHNWSSQEATTMRCTLCAAQPRGTNNAPGRSASCLPTNACLFFMVFALSGRSSNMRKRLCRKYSRTPCKEIWWHATSTAAWTVEVLPFCKINGGQITVRAFFSLTCRYHNEESAKNARARFGLRKRVRFLLFFFFLCYTNRVVTHGGFRGWGIRST